MSYENQLIREATERFTPWCSACERDADDCICEELCDHLRETVNPFTDVIDPESLDYSRGVKIIRDSEGKLHFRPAVCSSDSGEDVCVSPASPEVHSFPEWLEKHNDHLHLPESFQEWLDQNSLHIE